MSVEVTDGTRPWARVRGRFRQVSRESLVRNSAYLMATTALNAASGFAFWLVVARLFPVAEVGRATTLLSAVALLSYLALLGLDTTVVRRLPTARQPADLVAAATVLVGLGSVLVCGAYALLTPWTAPGLAFVADSPLALATFVVLAAGAALNLFTDHAFVGLRLAKYNLVINGVLMSVLKLGLPWLVAGGSALAIFAASGVASTVAAAISLGCLARLLGRPRRLSLDVLRTDRAYAAANYLGSGLNLLPLLVLPLLALNDLGPVAAAGWFVAFQIATLLNSAGFAVGEALFAEGSHEPAALGRLARRSALLMLAALVVPVLVVVVAARPLLALFGPSYAATASGALVVLALAAFPVALYTWTSFLLKVTAQLRVTVVSNLVLAVSTVLVAVAGAAQAGLTGLAIGWAAGNLAAGLVGLAGLGWRRRRRPAHTGRSAA